jgi:hypothetical protein
MKQTLFGFHPLPKKTRKEVFPEEMNRVVPWPRLVALIAPHVRGAHQALGGRPPFAVEVMLESISDMSGSTVGLGDVEVQHLFAGAQLGVQRDSGPVFNVCLDEDDMGAFGSRYSLNLPDQGSRDALSTEKFVNRKVVDVGFGTRLLEFDHNIRREPADNTAFGDGCHRNEVRPGQQRRQVGVVRLLLGICGDVFKSGPEHAKHAPHQINVLRRQDSNRNRLFHGT